ncbi:unnamed protein product, partial [Linum tenue]
PTSISSFYLEQRRKWGDLTLWKGEAKVVGDLYSLKKLVLLSEELVVLFFFVGVGNFGYPLGLRNGRWSWLIGLTRVDW